MSRRPPPTFDRWPMPPTPAWQIGPGWTELPWTTRWRRGARALLVVALAKLVRLLPYGVACALGRCMGSVACRLNGALRRTALENLGRAFPLLDDARRRDLERDSLRHFGQLVAEMTQDRYSDWHIEELVDYPPECQRVVEEALAQKRGVVMVTGHIGNWEIIGRRIARAGQPLFVVAREQNAPLLTRWIERSRRLAGIGLVWRRPHQRVGEELQRLLQQNSIVALLCDQDTGVRSVFVPFFGHLASTPRGPGELALRSGAPLVIAWSVRLPGNRHRLLVERLERPPCTGDHERDLQAIVAAATQRLEAAIRDAPAGWTWFHRRWKTRPAPDGVPQSAGSAAATD